MKRTKIVTFLIIASFFLLIGWFTFCNYGTIAETLSEFIDHRGSIGQLSTDITNQMNSDDLFHKDEFINLNGLYGRISGRRLYNEVLLLNNGYLTDPQQTLELNGRSIQWKTEDLVDFANSVEDRGSHFIYAQFPDKYDMDKVLMPEGYGSDIPKEVENMLNSFQKAGIDVVDTLPQLTQSAEDIEENFYRTDHHWKPAAAFKAFQIIMEHLKEIYPDQPYDKNIMNPDNWTVHEKPDWYLGSFGRRVGEYYAGLDSLYWMTPNFETNVSFYNAQTNEFYSGDYETAFLRDDYIQNKGNVLHRYPYVVYIGGDYSITKSRNLSASSDQKILIIKDSYTLPLQTFFSMIFREVETLDPRYYKASTMLEYIDQTHPDIVIMGISTQNISGNPYIIPVDPKTILLDENKELLLKSDYEIKAGTNTENYGIIYDKLESTKYYTLEIPEIIIEEGETEGFTVGIYNFKNKKLVNQTIFDIDYCNKYGDCEWTFQAPKDSKNIALLIYAIISGKTNNIALKFENIQLFAREPETN